VRVASRSVLQLFADCRLMLHALKRGRSVVWAFITHWLCQYASVRIHRQQPAIFEQRKARVGYALAFAAPLKATFSLRLKLWSNPRV
jgi:hypothetical protein